MHTTPIKNYKIQHDNKFIKKRTIYKRIVTISNTVCTIAAFELNLVDYVGYGHDNELNVSTIERTHLT